MVFQLLKALWSYNYLLPQNNYQLTAKILGTGEIVANRENVSVIELYNASWTISDTIVYRDITIRNNIVEPILFIMSIIMIISGFMFQEKILFHIW